MRPSLSSYGSRGLTTSELPYRTPSRRRSICRSPPRHCTSPSRRPPNASPASKSRVPTPARTSHTASNDYSQQRTLLLRRTTTRTRRREKMSSSGLGPSSVRRSAARKRQLWRREAPSKTTTRRRTCSAIPESHSECKRPDPVCEEYLFFSTLPLITRTDDPLSLFSKARHD